MKIFSDFSETNKDKLAENLTLVSKIEAMYFKYRANRVCPLRKYLAKEEIKDAPIVSEKNKSSVLEPQPSSDQYKKLEERIEKL